MEHFREEKVNKVLKKNVWDCGSNLYDSYELNSFKRQLDSAIANSPRNIRTLSMPHLPERCLSLQQQQQQPQSTMMCNNKSFKISRSFQKLLRFVFKSNNKLSISSTRGGNKSTFQVEEKCSNDRLYVVYDKSDQPVLSTIPELPEFEVPEITSLVRKSASERFMTTTAIGISCA